MSEVRPVAVTRVLLDTSVYRRTALKEAVALPTRVQMAGTESVIRLVTVRPRTFQDDWRKTSTSALAAICRAAGEGGIKLFISFELLHEYWNGSEQLRNADGDLLAGVNIDRVDVPIERSRFFLQSPDAYASKEARVEFCRWLLSFDGKSHHFPKNGVSGVPLPAYELESVASLDRFAALCRGISRHQWPDVFHLWTAERAGLPYFLTYDKKFVNVMTKTSKTPLRAEPILPAVLAARLCLYPPDKAQ